MNEETKMFALPFAALPGRFGMGFGSGYGLAVPYFNGEFYWLHDQQWEREGKRVGAWYQWSGGLGAQLHSYTFLAPKAGETRDLFGHRFKVFQTPERRGFTVRTSWALNDENPTVERLRELEQELQRWRGV